VCADTADSCRESARLISRMGEKPFLMPRSNALSKAKGSHAWKEMMLFREAHLKEFERRYHKRSNAESTNASLKGKYGEFLRSRRWHMQKREVGLRIIAHNIRRLVRCRIREEVELLDQA
jgi:transposase